MKETFYVYILQSIKDRGWYIGFTIDLIHRYGKHQNGEVVSTRFRRPLRLIFYECFLDKKDAKARERFLKSGFGRAQMKKALHYTLLEQ